MPGTIFWQGAIRLDSKLYVDPHDGECLGILELGHACYSAWGDNGPQAILRAWSCWTEFWLSAAAYTQAHVAPERRKAVWPVSRYAKAH